MFENYMKNIINCNSSHINMMNKYIFKMLIKIHAGDSREAKCDK